MKRAFILIALFAASAQASDDTLPIREQFTTLRTIAGTGQVKEDTSSPTGLWLPEFEGANPRDVELSNPHTAGTDAFGRIYICDKESHSILRISADGQTLTTVAGTHLAADGFDTLTPATDVALDNPNGLYVFADGGFLILDTGNSKIRKVTADGQCETLLTYPPGFGLGRGLTATPDGGTIYFNGEVEGTLQNVLCLQPLTAQPPFVVGQIPHGGSGLGNIDLARDRLFLGVTSRGDSRVYLIHVDGTLPTRIIAGTGSGDEDIDPIEGATALSTVLADVRGIAFRPDGSYFLATMKGGDILFVDTNGFIHHLVDGDGGGNEFAGDGLPLSSPGDKIAEPRHIHIASTGELIITTNDNGFIRAVVPACPPVAPEIEFENLPNGLNARWDNSQGGVYSIVEESTNLDDWSLFRTFAPEENSFRPTLDEPRKFFRLIVPRAPES